ncbi:hypothetical protein U9M48_015871 [Paspalum notatum var. saurae]|uniref:Uncharacterized protein n=1 Tax=Paspalum notatum var. saurae TaxID=547442 RepID=A0AAQ3T5U9_PASNO
MINTIAHGHHRPQPQQELEQAPALKPKMMMMKKKKQGRRRRTHTSRPYQESLLNMAEARREIITALKIHRATMAVKQPQHCSTYQQEAQLQQLLHQCRQHQMQVAVEDEAPLLAESYASFADQFPLANWTVAPATGDNPAGSCGYTSPVLPRDLTPLEVPTAAMGGLEHLARSLPAQPLGLNVLTSFFQGFSGSVDDDASGDLFGIPSMQSSSAAASSYSAYSSSPAMGVASTHGHRSPALSATEKYSSVDAPAAALGGPVLDDGEMQSTIGEMKADMEWSEATAADVAATSAWWSDVLLESMESGGGEGGGEIADAEGGAAGCTAEDVEAAGLPSVWRWLCEDGAGQQGQSVVTAGGNRRPAVLGTMHDGDDKSYGEDMFVP